VELLAGAFLKAYCAENDLPQKTFEPRVMELLGRYPWPGNVRELRNQVERMIIMSPGRTIRLEDVGPELRAGKAPGGAPAPAAAAPDASPGSASAAVDLGDLTIQEAKKRFEETLILQALERNDWNITKAADELGLERTNLHKKIKQYGLAKKE